MTTKELTIASIETMTAVELFKEYLLKFWMHRQTKGASELSHWPTRFPRQKLSSITWEKIWCLDGKPRHPLSTH